MSDFLNAYDKTWGRFKTITYPAPGNHEYETGSAQVYLDYFGSRAGGRKAYYAFNLNGWRIYSLNSECKEIDCAAERDWMRADILAHPRSCQLMFMHRPRYSSSTAGTTSVRPFWSIAYNNRFELALAGHDHKYERFAPMNPFGAVVADGIRSFVVGTGGRSLKGIGTRANGSVFRYNQNYGVLFLRLRPSSYDWEFRAIGGSIIDSGTGTCR